MHRVRSSAASVVCILIPMLLALTNQNGRVCGVFPESPACFGCACVVLVSSHLLQLPLGETFSRPPTLLPTLTGCVSDCPAPFLAGVVEALGAVLFWHAGGVVPKCHVHSLCSAPPGGPCARDLLGACVPWSEPLRCIAEHWTSVHGTSLFSSLY